MAANGVGMGAGGVGVNCGKAGCSAARVPSRSDQFRTSCCEVVLSLSGYMVLAFAFAEGVEIGLPQLYQAWGCVRKGRHVRFRCWPD